MKPMTVARGMARRGARIIATAALLLALLLDPFAAPAAAAPIAPPQFAAPEFGRTWERWDRPVYRGEAARSYTWGGQITGALREAYGEGADGQRLVQYFDKSRMEINDPAADPADPFYVTQGLLARDMIRGEIQEGDATFRPAPQGPARVPFGDLDDTGAGSPTYASLRGVLAAGPVPAGQGIVDRLSRAGQVAADPALARYGVTSAGVLPGTPAEAPGFEHHAIASVFRDFIGRAGPLYAGGQTVTAPLYEPIQYVFGYPITEAYWATVQAAGARKDVLIQCFERRCLTYTPSNDDAFRVEMANTGLQYHEWRYRQVPDGPTGAWSPAAPASLSGSVIEGLLPLPDGRALLLGRDQAAPFEARSQRYDPATNTWSTPAPLALPDRRFFAAVPLADGRALAIGGSGGQRPTAGVERYDPATDRWETVAPMLAPRTSGHTATLLADGRVLVVGGAQSPAGVALGTAEIYDPAADRWAAVGALATARYDHTATLLPDARVLVAGGRGDGANGNNGVLARAEIYDPATARWSPAAPLATGRWGHTARAQPDGRVLVLGGVTGGGVTDSAPERFDPAGDRWEPFAAPPASQGDPASRNGFTLTPLADGQFLLGGGQVAERPGCGGGCTFAPLADTLRYDPATDRWTADAPLSARRAFHRDAPLADGRVLVVGGVREGAATAEVYTPPSAPRVAGGDTSAHATGATAVRRPNDRKPPPPRRRDGTRRRPHHQGGDR